MKVYKIILLIFLFVSACAPSTRTAVYSHHCTGRTATEESTETPEATATPTHTATSEPTLTSTPTIELSPTVTATPTFAFPSVTVNKQAHCRYGPSVAYLHAADLYPGDVGTCTRAIYLQQLAVYQVR